MRLKIQKSIMVGILETRAARERPNTFKTLVDSDGGCLGIGKHSRDEALILPGMKTVRHRWSTILSRYCEQKERL